MSCVSPGATRLPEGCRSFQFHPRSKGKLVAYLEPSDVFSQANAIPALWPEDFASEPAQDESFEPTEWAIISLARHDSLATLREPRRSRFSRLLFGQPRTYSLSGERLEALRSLAVEAWHRPLAISLPALGGFIAAGFSSAQLALLLATTGASRAMAGQTAASSALSRNAA
jgi:hypothetical protein